MAVPLRPSQNTSDDASDLLRALIEMPPAAERTPLAPATLHSVETLREHALRGFLRRTWVDGVLPHTERLLMIAALLVFGWWLIDGPLRDWLHTQNALPAAPVAAAPHTAPPPQARQVPLPFTRPDTAAPRDDFLVPRQVPRPAPVVALVPQPSRLTVPALALDTPVKEVFVVDGEWEVADYAAGYMHGTALPGEGNTVLAGHAGLRGAVFRDLGRLSPGDDLYLDAGGWRYHYRVRSATSVWPTQIEVLDQTLTPVLTLITCTNWDTQRLVVVADLADARPTPDGPP